MDAVARRLPAAHSPSMLNGDRDRKMQGRRHWCGQINAAHKRKTPPPVKEAAFSYSNIEGGEFLVLGRPGSDLLSQGLSHSTIGAEAFNGRVRDGIGLRRFARATRPAKDKKYEASDLFELATSASHSFWSGPCGPMDTENESNQANRTISTGKLHALLHFHIRPINVVVFHGSQGNARFEVGFPLRCFQRLSRPYIAMLHCRWRDNSSTRGTFTPVLSY
jgi:hypothetical protein